MGFDPLSYSPRFGIDASKASSITSSGGLVSQINDLSGSGFHLTQSTTASKPSTGVRTSPSGLNCLGFDGIDDSINSGSGFTQAQPLTLIVTGKFDAIGAGIYHNIVGGGGSAPTLSVNPNSQYEWYAGASLIATSPQPDTTNFRVMIGVFNGSSTQIWVDGVLIKTGDASSSGYSAGNIYVGSYSGGASWMRGAVGEYWILSGALSALDVKKWTAYLGFKWTNLTQNLLRPKSPYRSQTPDGSVSFDRTSASVFDLMVDADNLPDYKKNALRALRGSGGDSFFEETPVTASLADPNPVWFNPNTLSPLGWYDASDTASITSSGGVVSQFNDKSGNSRHLTQGTSANRPITGTRTINGRNTLDFDGVNDNLQSGTFTQAQPITAFVVVQSDVTNPSNSQALGNDVPNNTPTLWISNGGWAYFAGSVAASGTAVNTNAHILEGVFSGASSGLWLDGTFILGTNPGTNGYSTARILMGSDGNQTASCWDGRIGELLVFAGAMNSTNRAAVRYYLGDKWAIPYV